MILTRIRGGVTQVPRNYIVDIIFTWLGTLIDRSDLHIKRTSESVYIQHKMEERISKMNDLDFDGPWTGEGEKKIHIAQITFAFHN